jgi:cleavage stimulation factor subunit 3
MAPELQENGEQHEGAAWGTDNEGNGAVKETQHSDQEHQDPNFSHDQASHGDQEEQLQQLEEDGDEDEDEEVEDEAIEEMDEEGEEDEGDDEADADAEAETETGAEPQEEGDEDGEEAEYDPESISMTPAQVEDTTPSAPAAPAAPNTSAKPAKPKKSGGFLVGDSDDEDDARAPNPVAQTRHSASAAPQPQQPPAATPSPAQGQVGTAPVAVDNVARAAPAPAAAAAAPPASDLAASLEARVTEDPRGEMDAWLGLMAEYRRLNQLDSLRQVYERFIQRFPQAVSHPIAVPTNLTNLAQGRDLGRVDQA